ncbi:CPBP family intramembrane glutamic endopeptidase [Limosilactobacillus caccae]|uniref:CPBP family intramembrane glutamic endopeptidase n=1 Tax=Limosilactobacillus caccae TaxID=1926284 RepID=UPI000970E6E7|nr:CPBP family intramembrane glutamic endopeptidase [Limosilactobacillus caccae]
MTGNDYLKIWYRVQLGAMLVILAMMMIRNIELHRRLISLALVIMVGVLAIGLAVELMDQQLPMIVRKVNAWLQVIAQPLILVFAWDVIVREIIVLLHLPSRGVVTMMILYYLIMFAPFANVIGELMDWTIERLVFVVWLAQVVFTPLIALPTDLVDNSFLLTALSTGAVGAVAFFVLTTTVMRTWRLSWPGLKPHWSGDFNWWILGGLVVVALGYIALNSGEMPSLANASWEFTLSAFEAAVMEESLFRFAILGILFYAWRNVKQRLPLALVTSSVLFGVVHLTNYGSQEWSMTVLQAITAAGIGLFFATVYVYTGQLWLAMMMHFLLDWTAFIASDSTLMTGKVTMADWISTAIELLVFGGITAWMMFGQRRKVMERHVDRLTGDKQRFGFMVQY